MPLELQRREEHTNIQDADAAGLQLQQCASQVGPAAAAGEQSTGTINKKYRTRKELLDENVVLRRQLSELQRQNEALEEENIKLKQVGLTLA